MLVIYQPTRIQSKKFPPLKFNSPGLYMLEKQKSGWLVSIADPTQELQEAKWEIADKKQSTILPSALNKGETIQIKISN